LKAKKNIRLWIALIVTAALLVPTLFILSQRLEGAKPEVQLDSSSLAVGVSHELSGTVTDVGSGVRKIWIGLYKDGKESVLFEKLYAGSVLWGEGETQTAAFKVTISPVKQEFTDGEALLRIVARDYSWRSWFNGNRTYIEKSMTIDTRPPRIEVLTGAHNISPGGSGLVVYRLSEDCPHNGVKVGNNFFPGHAAAGYPADVRLAFFALAHDQRPGSAIFLQAADLAGNLAKRGFRHYIKKKRFRRDTINISDSFLRSKTHEFSMMIPGSEQSGPLDTFLAVNRDVRRKNSEAIARITARTEADTLWEGRFLRLPNAAPRARFADRRTYRYKGRDIDRQVHLGIDLASTRQSPIPAANSGRVVFAGPMGIYGDTVIIDHGLGLFSLYAHLSSFACEKGQTVAKGGIIGRTGSSGMAGGDHLPFGMLVHNTFVNPVEWWDEKWIVNNISGKLELEH